MQPGAAWGAMAVFERYVPWMIYAKDRDLLEFYFTVPNRPGGLKEALDVFARYAVNILNLSVHSMPEWERAPVFLFADFTELDVDVEDVKRELEFVTGDRVYVKEARVRGFMMDEFAFPIYVLPSVRSIMVVEPDFHEMIKGVYEKLGDVTAVFLYHLAYSGGKFLARYLSERLSLDRRELLAEVLKVYQAGGWGRVELVRYDLRQLDIVVRVYDSIECKIFKGSTRPASQFIRGHLSGLLSELLGEDIRVIEAKCIAMGDPYCEFYAERVRTGELKEGLRRV